MTDRTVSKIKRSRLAACIAAAGLLFAPAALAQTRLPPPPTITTQADARQDQLEELQGQLTAATAENERLQYELIQAQREIARLRGMVGELAGVNQSLGTPSAPGAAPPPPSSNDSALSGGANPTPVTPRADAGATPSNLNSAQQAHTGVLGTMPANTPVTSAPDPGAAYARARELLINGNYAEAELAFAEYLENFPSADSAPDARFWYGFTLLARNNYQNAAASFVQYLQDTPQGARAPEAQVRLGMALAGMGQARQACAAFAALPRRYPNAARTVRDLATRESRAANCAA